MTTQAYLIVENNVVTNNVIWDGNPATWTPPVGSVQLVAATTPALIWDLNTERTEYVLTQQVGSGAIGFTWNGSVLTTNAPKPPAPPPPTVIPVTIA